MPIKKRREKSRALDQYCREELKTGPCLLGGVGYFNYIEDTCDTKRMAKDWERHGDSILSEWIADNPGKRPYGWWQFDAPEPKRTDESERDYLARHGLLTQEEINND